MPSHPVSPPRREFLRRAGLASAGAALAAGLPRPAAAADATLGAFPHGVASGDPTANGVIIWTRVTPSAPGPVAVTYVVARDLALTDPVATGTEMATSDRDHTVKVDVSGLSPATYYFYRFDIPGSRSIVGRTKTAPSGAVDRSLRFGVASCSNYTGGFFNSYATMAERNDLDAVIHVGDYIYEYGNGGDRYGPGEGETPETRTRNHVPVNEMITLADYRGRHGNYKLDPDLRRLHQLFPFITVWDDHESTDNSRTNSANNHSPANEGGLTWPERRDMSRRAYNEWMPIRGNDPAVIYRKLSYGRLMDLIMLDTRLDGRDDEAGIILTTGIAAQIDDPARELIGDAQRSFLYDALNASTATWKVLGQQVILGQWNAGGLPVLSQLPIQDRPVFVVRSEGNSVNPDQWDGYTAERRNLFAQVRGTGATQKVQNLVVLTGDVHTSWALDLHENPAGTVPVAGGPPTYMPMSGAGALGVEFVCPSITSANFEGLGPVGVAGVERSTLTDNRHVRYVDFDEHGYYVLDVNAQRVQADWYYIDTVTKPSESERLGASWRVLAGVNHLDVVNVGTKLPDGQNQVGIFSAAPAAAPNGPANPAVPEAAPAGSGTGGNPEAIIPEVPVAALLPASALAAMGAAVALRRRRDARPAGPVGEQA